MSGAFSALLFDCSAHSRLPLGLLVISDVMYICICICIYMYVYVYVWKYIYTYVYIYERGILCTAI